MRADTCLPVPGVFLPSGNRERPASPAFPMDDPEQLPRAAADEVPGAAGGLDQLIRLAALTLGADVATVSLARSEGLVLESEVRLPDLRATRRSRPLATSLARYTLDADEPLVVHDALTFPLDPEVTSLADGFRSYAGVPLHSSGSGVPGTLSVAGYAPRDWTPAEIEVLRIIARTIVAEIDLKEEIRRLERAREEQAISERRNALQQLALGLRHELNNALAGLILEAELLAGGGAGYERYREAVASIQGQVWRIHDVLRRLDDVDALPTKPYLDCGVMIDLSEQGRT
ncbi:MAG TPA: GAF domain-containing protein [Longimicrobiaceae bacterium]|nr:GAF domain-containing protein [Longimicrobiaceae bacterium]